MKPCTEKQLEALPEHAHYEIIILRQEIAEQRALLAKTTRALTAVEKAVRQIANHVARRREVQL